MTLTCLMKTEKTAGSKKWEVLLLFLNEVHIHFLEKTYYWQENSEEMSAIHGFCTYLIEGPLENTFFGVLSYIQIPK